MSSIEPDGSGGEVDSGEEISGGFVVEGGDGAALFEFAEEVLDQMARLVEVAIEIAARAAVFARRDHGRFSSACQHSDAPLIGIEGLVGDQQIGGHLRQQRIGSGQIVGLSGGQEEAQRVAKGIDQCVDFGAQPALAAANRVVVIFFWCAGAVLVRPHNGAVNDRVFVVGIGGQGLEPARPHPLLGPPAEPPVGILPIAASLRQVAPGDSGAVSIQHRLDQSAIISSGGADIANFPRQQVFYSLSLIIAQSISGHGSAYLQPTFDNSHKSRRR